MMARALQARSAEEGSSAFEKGGWAAKVGEKIVDERVTLLSDLTDPLLLTAPFEQDGRPLGRQARTSRGVLSQGPRTARFTYTQCDSVHWRWINATFASHPIHLHGVYFHLENRGDLARSGHTAGRRSRSL